MILCVFNVHQGVLNMCELILCLQNLWPILAQLSPAVVVKVKLWPDSNIIFGILWVQLSSLYGDELSTVYSRCNKCFLFHRMQLQLTKRLVMAWLVWIIPLNLHLGEWSFPLLMDACSSLMFHVSNSYKYISNGALILQVGDGLHFTQVYLSSDQTVWEGANSQSEHILVSWRSREILKLVKYRLIISSL